jgi:hypothetical protein
VRELPGYSGGESLARHLSSALMPFDMSLASTAQDCSEIVQRMSRIRLNL